MALSQGLPSILGGDFNAHQEGWSQGEPNRAGTLLLEVAEAAGLEVLATFPQTGGRPDLLLSTQVAEGRT